MWEMDRWEKHARVVWFARRLKLNAGSLPSFALDKLLVAATGLSIREADTLGVVEGHLTCKRHKGKKQKVRHGEWKSYKLDFPYGVDRAVAELDNKHHPFHSKPAWTAVEQIRREAYCKLLRGAWERRYTACSDPWFSIMQHFRYNMEDALDALLLRDRRNGWYMMPTPNGVHHFFHKYEPQPREPDAVCYLWLWYRVAVPSLGIASMLNGGAAKHTKRVDELSQLDFSDPSRILEVVSANWKTIQCHLDVKGQCAVMAAAAEARIKAHRNDQVGSHAAIQALMALIK